MVKDSVKIIGLTVSLSWLAFLSLAIFIKAVSNATDIWFSKHNMIILIVSGVLVLFLIFIGAISLGALKSKGKTIV